jgi:hypothetical protein
LGLLGVGLVGFVRSFVRLFVRSFACSFVRLVVWFGGVVVWFVRGLGLELGIGFVDQSIDLFKQAIGGAGGS